jgi:aminoglycoside/choline kinase family phosphotransferase
MSSRRNLFITALQLRRGDSIIEFQSAAVIYYLVRSGSLFIMDDARNSSSLGEEFKAFIRLFLKEHGEDPASFEMNAIPADGSRRRFWRIITGSSELTYVAMINDPVDGLARRENFAYLMIGRHLHGKGLPLPRIHVSHMEKGWFIMEDFGTVNLQHMAASAADRVPIYERIAELLFHFQIEGAKGFSPSWTCQTERYDTFVMRRYESEYFRDAFLCNYLGLKKEWPELEWPFTYLAEKASLADPRFFLHRDFQSRNIMVMKNRIGVLDWQGARLGPLAYDLASLLIDPYTKLSDEERGRVFRRYVELMGETFPDEVERFKVYYPYLALQRNLQILGAFSFLTQIRKKAHFRAYIAPALNTLNQLLLELKDERLSPLTDLALSLELADASRDAMQAG